MGESTMTDTEYAELGQEEREEKNDQKVYPVYFLKRAYHLMRWHVKKALPKEALGALIGWRCYYQSQNFVKIVDVVSGEVEASTAHAQFTKNGILDYTTFLDERYGRNVSERPRLVGLYHSHPFGHDPHFSGIDLNTFFNFPYNEPGNVFFLLDPLINATKAFVLRKSQNDGTFLLEQVPYVVYYPRHGRKYIL